MGVFDKAKDFIHSEEVEEKSDAVLRNTIDDKIGNESNS